MYFMSDNRKKSKINRITNMIRTLEKRIKATEMALEIFQEELEEAYRGQVVTELLNEIGLYETSKDNGTT